jgi:glycosyltransferase involved in cell wall biosynthesis
MRILHVVPSISPRRGGPSAVVPTVAAALADRGHDVVVASTDDDGPEHRASPTPLPHKAVTYRIFPRQSRFYTFSWPMTRWLMREASRFQVVHVHAVFSYPSSAAAFAAHRQRVPFILRPLGTLGTYGMKQRRRRLKSLSWQVIEHRMVSSAAIVQCTSELEADEVRALAPNARCIVIPNPVPPPTSSWDGSGFLAAHPELKRCAIILYLGRIDPKKGLEVLVDATADIARSGAAWVVIAGEGEARYVASLRDRARRLGHADRIIWTGFVEGDRRWEALGAATVSVLPSHAENFGVSVVEAMLIGRPVIVSERVGIHTEVASAGAGIVFDGTRAQLERAILKIVQNPKAASVMGTRGKKYAGATYAPTRVAALLEAAYVEAISGR